MTALGLTPKTATTKKDTLVLIRAHSIPRVLSVAGGARVTGSVDSPHTNTFLSFLGLRVEGDTDCALGVPFGSSLSPFTIREKLLRHSLFQTKRRQGRRSPESRAVLSPGAAGQAGMGTFLGQCG